MYIQQTRAKLVLFGCGVFLAEGVLRMLFPGFPVIEILSAQSGLILAYIAGKSANNSKKYGNGGDRDVEKQGGIESVVVK